MKKPLILGLETSCDETSAAVVGAGEEIYANIISSQITTHQKFGGVVPEIASRKHLEAVNLVIESALKEAGVGFHDLDAVSVTYGPGLVGALLVGVSAAKALAYALEKPLIAVNHIWGHIYAGFLEHKNLSPPLLVLVVSGGHTNLLYLKAHGELEVLGETRDDAAGEAFDKISRAIGLGYPGGPAVEKAAKLGDPLAIDFPRAWLEEGSMDFSFSGLKSAVLNYINNLRQRNEVVNVYHVAASFQEAVVEVLVEKTLSAVKELDVGEVLLAGGVAANGRLRQELHMRLSEAGRNFYCPSLRLCTDNAAMIACAGYYQYLRRDFASLYLNAVPNLSLI